MSSTDSHTTHDRTAARGGSRGRQVCAQALALKSTLYFNGETLLLLSRP